VQNLGLFENMVVAWHEADGTTSGGYQAKHLGRSETDLRREAVQEALRKDGGAQTLDFAAKVTEAVSKMQKQPGFDIKGKFTSLEKTESRIVYKRIMTARRSTWNKQYRVTKEDIRSNRAMLEGKKHLSAKERDYWWRLAHGRVSLKAHESKWRVENGVRVSALCPVCKKEPETKRHYDFECEGLQCFIGQLGEIYEQCKTEKEQAWKPLSKDMWCLSVDSVMSETLEMLVAKARWLYHKERCNIMHKSRRMLDTGVLLEKTRVVMQRWLNLKQKKKR
jgi:hypothetical protein